MDDREYPTVTGLPAPPDELDVIVIQQHFHGPQRKLEVIRAPDVAAISSQLLVDVEFAPWGGARFDGDVLTINAINGVFRYRVDRRPRWPWARTADGWEPQPDYRMQRIDGVA